MNSIITWNEDVKTEESEKLKLIFEKSFPKKIRKDREAREFVISTISKSCNYNYDDVDTPIWVGYKLTNRCNLNCIHCWANNRNYEPSTEDVMIAIDKFKEEGISFIGLSGGEVFLRKDIFEILKYIKEKGMFIEIFTNLTLLDECKIKKLTQILDEKNDIIQVSLDGSNSSIYKAQRKMDYFDIIKENILRLKSNGLQVRISYVATHENVHDLYNTYKIICDMGADGFSVSPVYPKNKGKDIFHMLDMDLYYDEIYKCLTANRDTELTYFLQIDFFEKIYSMVKKINIPIKSPYIISSGFLSVYIDANGCVYPEFQLDYEELCYGNIYKDSWNVIKDNIIRLKPVVNFRTLDNTKCGECKFLSICLNHSYEFAYQKHKSMNFPNPNCSILGGRYCG
ncbi:radical SAM additional 4Fe4S-binding SPASM domain-containing protein [Clostridium collagenovorans DSM 3089]|uniref:Radical SAM additional 4Fe4S-binding SPASM domain-containing protein n=1 Tax=Clostridium collagenovorans DSM 3089 TaxID=1121306 RepID=A0A1M5X616_9CLOT|nr:radical SAM protein [Clostridium collagenovorans]SHH95265.1 radical SAM additional 4Fe4S-binding SPASM domain-containing protein [Clostridium collagenovorans DSM 3089]